jgi:hypothetical protein
MGTPANPDYQRLSRADERERSEKARLALENHIAVHGC